MKLQEIDKHRYQKHLRLTFAGIAIVLAILALGISTIMIRLFSTPDESHFWFNLGGVVIAAVIVVKILQSLRQHPFLTEVVYVWDLKQLLNRIYRKQRRIEELAESNDHDAMRVLLFQYRGSKQLYELDDNTITIDSLMLKLRRLETRMQEAGLDTEPDEFDPALLDKF